MFNPYDVNSGEYFLVKGGVAPSKVEDCLKWAFGKTKLDPNDSIMEMMVNWNKVHKDIFEISPKDSIAAALVCVGKAYCISELKSDPNGIMINLKKGFHKNG